jgi:hypothetical protein
MNWILARLREPSTIRGLVWLLTVAGITLSPEQIEAIAVAGMAVAGLLGVFLPEEPKRVEIQLPPVDLISKATRPTPSDAMADGQFDSRQSATTGWVKHETHNG